jgi:prepilin peptidase CpaA
MSFAFAPFLMLLPAVLLLCAAWSDLRARIIDHWVVIAMAATAPLYWWAMGLQLLPNIAWGQHPVLMLASLFDPASVMIVVALAVVMFFVFAIFFAIGWMGGGDVKLLASLSLWLMPRELLMLLVVEALAGLVVTVLATVHHKVKAKPGPVEVPRGVAIAFAGLWVFVERYFNQFG